MRRITGVYITLALAVAVTLILICLLAPAGRAPDWKLIGVSFGGFTNRSGTSAAALSIQNQTGSTIKVMDHYYVEWPETSSFGAEGSDKVRWVGTGTNSVIAGYSLATTGTNHIIGAGRRLPTGTNLVVRAGQTGVLRIPVPEGNHWRVSLEFTRPNLQTRLAEYLGKPHGAWVKYVPDRLRGVIIRRSVTCEVSANAR